MVSPDNDRVNIAVGAGRSRRDVMRQMGMAAASVGALGGLAGCSGIIFQDEDEDETEDATGTGNGDEPDYQIVELIPPPTDLDFTTDPPSRSMTMVTHDAATAFFNPTIAGLHDAANQLGWEANFTGPTGGHDVEEQVDILESAVDAGPDVLATTITDDRAYDAVIEEAIENDIYVITYNTNAFTDEEMRERYGRALAYTGQDDLAAGYVCGLEFLEQLPDDASLVTVGICCPGHAQLETRAEGIELAIENNSDLELTERLDYTDNPGEGVSRIEDHLVANEDVDGIVGTDAYTLFIGEAVANQGAEGDVIGGGFDLEEPTLEFIQEGTMQFTIGQDPYSQGYIPTIQAWQYLERGIPSKDYPTGAEVINEENVDFALERSDWGTLREQQGD